MKTKVLDLTNSTKKRRPKEISLPEAFSNEEISAPVIEERIKVNSSRKRKRHLKRPYAISLIVLCLILTPLIILITKYVVLPATRINTSVNKIQDNVYALGNDLKDKDVSKIDTYFDNIQLELDNIDSEIAKYNFLKSFKYTKGYYDNLQVGREILGKSDALIEKSLPEFKETLRTTGFKVDETQVVTPPVEGEDDSAMSLILKETPEYLAFYEEIEPDIIDIMADFKRLDPEYLPSLPGKDLKTSYNKMTYYIDKFPETSTNVKNFVSGLPELLGTNGSTEYMILLQNETEMRSSGGLLTAVGNATITDGEIGEMKNLKDMWDLEIYNSYTLGIDVGYRNIYGQNVLMNLGCGSTYLRAQDSGIYPDLNSSLNIFKDYYDTASYYDPENYPPYDHAVILNHHSGEKLLSLIQPLTVEEYGEVTSENLFEFIKAETDDSKYAWDTKNKKSIIGEVANAAKKKFMELPLTEMPKVVETMINLFYAKDVAFYSKDANMQNYFDKYALSGRQSKDFTGDYLHLNEAQNCSLKLNKYMRDSVEMTVNIADDGSISDSVKVHWWQPQVYDASLEGFYSGSLNYSYRAWIRLFTPPNSFGFDSDGFEQSGYVGYWPQEYYDDIPNKEISDNIIQFDHRRMSPDDPIPEHNLNVSYKLPDSINYNKDGSYKLLLQKHPGKSWSDGFEEYTININHNGQTSSIKFPLDRDKVLTYKDGVISVDNYHKGLDWILDIVDSVPFEKMKN
jgi:hypothetical protein